MSTPPVHLLVAHLGALGDAVLAVPAVRALVRRVRPRGVVFGGAGARAALVARGVPGVAVGVDLTSPEAAPLFAGGAPAGEVGRALAGCDEAVLLVRRGEGLAAGLRAAGVARAHVVEPPARGERGGAHACDRMLDGVAALALSGGGPGRVPARARAARAPRLRVPPADREAARRTLEGLGLGRTPILAIHPGSGGPAKRWPFEGFLALARAAEGALGLVPLVLLGPVETDGEDAEARVRAAGLPALVAPPLPRLAAVLRAGAAYVGNDAGPTHLAAAVGAPTLALFGPSDAGVWAPRGRRVRVIAADGADGLRSLEVEKVLRELQGMARRPDSLSA